MEKLTTVEACFASLGLDYKKANPDLSCYPEKDREAMKAQLDIIVVVDAINRSENNGKEWFPDWGNSSEYKYEIWWHMGGSSGSGFSYYDYVNWYSNSICGSRLCFKSRKGCKHMAQHFTELYKKAYLK